jgi:hypothetical protein
MASTVAMRQKSRSPRPRKSARDPVAAFLRLPEAERQRIVAEYERGIPFSELRPLTKAERARWERVKRKKLGRPKVGKGVRVISLSVERGLLERADSYAQENGLTRAQLFARGLVAVLNNSAG